MHRSNNSNNSSNKSNSNNNNLRIRKVNHQTITLKDFSIWTLWNKNRWKFRLKNNNSNKLKIQSEITCCRVSRLIHLMIFGQAPFKWINHKCSNPRARVKVSRVHLIQRLLTRWEEVCTDNRTYKSEPILWECPNQQWWACQFKIWAWVTLRPRWIWVVFSSQGIWECSLSSRLLKDGRTNNSSSECSLTSSKAVSALWSDSCSKFV